MDYGSQTLVLGLSSFTIENVYFNPNGDSSIVGYTRKFNSEFFNSIAFNVATSPNITGLNLQATTGRMLYEFQWSLLLEPAIADQLEVLLQLHRKAIADKAENYWLTLYDNRLPVVDMSTPVRPVASGSTTALPGGGVRYYAQFKLILTEYSREVFMPQLRDSITMKAVEVIAS